MYHLYTENTGGTYLTRPLSKFQSPRGKERKNSTNMDELSLFKPRCTASVENIMILTCAGETGGTIILLVLLLLLLVVGVCFRVFKENNG